MPHAPDSKTVNRRSFLGRTIAAAALAPAAVSPGAAAEPAKTPPQRKLKIGLVGCGGRGGWIAGLFQQHGGYQLHALADYFPQVADRVGQRLGIDPARRFSGLSGYKKLIASGVEAVILQTPPYFFPEHVRAAVDAGLHVYMAKPVAVDAWGCLAVERAARDAAANKRCFLVDYQIPTDPLNIEVHKRIGAGGLGKVATISTLGFCGGFADPPRGKTLEGRLHGLVWVNDVALGCDYLGNFDIHAVDAAIWVAGRRPLWATGSSRICRRDPHGDSRDICQVVYQFDDGLILNHSGVGCAKYRDGALTCIVYGTEAEAQLNYWGKAYVRGGPKHYGGGNVENLYDAGAKRNIAEFHQWVLDGRVGHPSVPRAVDGCLTAVLGREAAARQARLSMEDLLKEGKRLEVDLTGLTV